MKLPFFLHSLRPRDIPGIAFVILVLAMVFFVSVKYPDGFAKHGVGGTFGPGWSCQYVPKGEPICMKDMPKASANQDR